MATLDSDISELQSQVVEAWDRLSLSDSKQKIDALQADLADSDIWQDATVGTAKSKELAALLGHFEPWQALRDELDDLEELAQMQDATMEADIRSQLAALEVRFQELKKELRFSGQYDSHNAILRLSAGVGGTDAQDWTDMLLRMYLRWAEKSGMTTELLEQSSGEEAGIKSAALSVSGPFAYGKLRSEHGVHRLVRLSPFNSDNLRQTSFALVEVLPQIDEPGELAVDEKDLRIDVFRAGGHGGQSVNTTDSAVRITHIPTSIVVSIQNERSQLQNREMAMKVLRSKLAQLQVEQHASSLRDLKATKSADWGSQIRNYVLHPYTMVKDTRTKYEDRDAASVLDGKLDGFIEAYLDA